MELKRSHQWLTEPSGSELFSNKRQMVELDAARPGFVTPHMSLSAWDNSLMPRQLTHCLFDPANAQHTSDLLGRNISPIDGQHIEEGRKDLQEQCNHVSSIGLPVAHTVHSSSFNLDTIRKAKFNELSESMIQLYGEGISRSFETGPSYRSGVDSTLSFRQTCSDIGNILPGPFTSKADGNFIQNFNNEGAAGVIPMGDVYDKGGGNVLSTFQPFDKGVENFVLMGQSLQKAADCNIFSMSPTYYNKGHDHFMSLLSYEKGPENLFMIESSHHEENANVLLGGETALMVSSQDRADQNNDRISHEVRSKTISFGDSQKETTMGSSVRVINSYENFSHDPATAKDPSPRVDTLLVPKSKDSKTAKKGSTNTFPTNVKALLSTGMFDGITVKYYSWSREKNLKGIIKGTGYLCGCGNCNLNKVLNAYEFEQHANCKTKHPNNHIYFENGKTVYGVVQELKNTPQEKLFDVLQNVTGSDINQKNFNTWKASYQVATLELERIYGKDAVTFPS